MFNIFPPSKAFTLALPECIKRTNEVMQNDKQPNKRTVLSIISFLSAADISLICVSISIVQFIRGKY